MAKITKTFLLLEYFEALASDPSFTTSKMFGCLALYYKGLNIAVIAESPGEKAYKDQKFKFDIWDGVLFPTDKEHHPSLLEQFPKLTSHPILGKWLYLPQQFEEFDDTLIQMVRLIKRQDTRFGIIPGVSKKNSTKNKEQQTKRSTVKKSKTAKVKNTKATR